MRTIHKHRITLGTTVLMLPATATFLHAAVQGPADEMYAWFEVDLDDPQAERVFVTAPTGGVIPDYEIRPLHRATVLQGAYVWHIYEVWP